MRGARQQPQVKLWIELFRARHATCRLATVMLPIQHEQRNGALCQALPERHATLAAALALFARKKGGEILADAHSMTLRQRLVGSERLVVEVRFKQCARLGERRLARRAL